ncbi:hypothetical protein SynBOUM118_02545 [Synechococcus sp. BOUM118]|nr:hypothetical protein SynBOUM118_02545 [Synechococcus sp. BOUM118]
MGDALTIRLSRQRLDRGTFDMNSELFLDDQRLTSGSMRQIAIDPVSRKRCS